MPGRPPKDGKKYGGNFRNYSSLWDERGYFTASKGEKPLIREFLAREHAGTWFAAIADSGQKHVIPWAPLNAHGRAGVVLFDEQLVTLPTSLELIDALTSLLTAGATKDELGSGNYTPRAWQLCGSLLREFEERSGHIRGGGWFTLALWLAQRDEEETQRRIAAEKEAKADAKRRAKGTTQKQNRRSSARAKSGVPPDRTSESAEALGYAPDANADGVQDVRHSGGVGNIDRPKTPNRSARQGQLTLFESSGGRGERT